MQFEFQEVMDSLETVPTDFHGLYEDNGTGGFKMRSDEHSQSAIKAIGKLNGSLRASRAEAKEFKSRAVDLTGLVDFGATPDEILTNVNARIEEARKTSKNGLDLQGKIDKMREGLLTEHQVKLDALQGVNTSLVGQIHGLLVDGEAKTSLAQAGAIDAELAAPHITKQVKVLDEGSGLKVQVIDLKTGDQRYSNSTGEPMTIPELVAEMKSHERFKQLFKSEVKSGGGTEKTRHTLGGVRVKESDMSPAQKIAAGIAKLNK